MSRSAAIVQAPAVALVDKVVGVAEGDITVLVTVLANVANIMTRTSVGVTVGAAKVELEAVTLVSDKIGVAVGGLPLGKGLILASKWVGCNEGRSSDDDGSELSEDHCAKLSLVVVVKKEIGRASCRERVSLLV